MASAARTPPASTDTQETRPSPEFLLPGVDDPPLTEVGVILLGFDPGRLLAGLGLSTLDGAGDPGLVALAVDRARHGAGPVDHETLLAAGGRRWRAVRDALPDDPVADASPRAGWERTLRALEPFAAGPTELAFLAACRMRRRAVDDHLAAG
ncbi:MAG TPA: DUF6187 family protein [Mycobacteriales bacterium]|nr:DUF6187 family protein [Mycobacteriales bacterium]